MAVKMIIDKDDLPWCKKMPVTAGSNILFMLTSKLCKYPNSTNCGPTVTGSTVRSYIYI